MKKTVMVLTSINEGKSKGSTQLHGRTDKETRSIDVPTSAIEKFISTQLLESKVEFKEIR